MPDTSTPPQAPRPHWLGLDRDETAYIAPMAAFLLLIAAGGWLGDAAYPYAYLARAVAVPVLLYVCWRFYTRISWKHWPLGVLFGVLGVVQWIGMQTLLEKYVPGYPWLVNTADVKPFNPYAGHFANAWSMWLWIAVRWATASITVPIMEELFWRDWLWRQITAPADFKMVKVGEWDVQAYLIVACVFALPHPQWWLTAIVWGLMVGGLLAWTKSLGACIVMHGVTNFLLGLYVLRTHEWQWW